jgi:pimeloyl-ACP methyl ester carboxylesterase
MTDDTTGPAARHYYSQRLRLHFVDWGNPGAPPLILLHGGRDHCRNWDWVARSLRKDWHIIAPDLRGHGDSQWVPDGTYPMSGFVYDLAQLIHQQNLAPVTIIAHSLGGSITLRYAGLFPQNVRKIVAIEGLGPPPAMQREREAKGFAQRMRDWIGEKRTLSGKLPRRYPSIEAAVARMQEENRHLSPEQARHLTLHGVNQNEDGTYSWKFDNYLRVWQPLDLTQTETEHLWSQITCPVLHVYGRESWAPDPEKEGLIKLFQNGKVAAFDRAGHWAHHDRLHDFLAATKAFLAE